MKHNCVKWREEGRGCSICDSLVHYKKSDIKELQDHINWRVNTLRHALEEIREIYVGMEGVIVETAPEGYQQYILKQIYDVAIKALNAELT